MIHKKALDKIKSLCNNEIEYILTEKDYVRILVPYDISAIEIQIEGIKVDEQVESFISGVNHKLNDMIDHLKDCKL